MNRRTAPRAVIGAVLAALSAGAADAQAQDPTGLSQEHVLLREAASLESAGDHRGAERVLARVLDANPGSLTGLLQMERVLLVQGRAEALLPIADRVLASDPGSALVHQIKVRALAVLDRPEQIEAAGEAWMGATPALEVPYREVARIWQQRGDIERAIRVLERGRKDVPRADALALELGEAYTRVGRWDEAAAEWTRAVGPEARGLNAVERRLRLLPDGGAHVLPGLVDALSTESASAASLRAAATLAIDAGMVRQAGSLVRRTSAALEPAARPSFLAEVARRADGAGLPEVAYWAYDALERGGDGERSQLWAIRARLADLALLLGDTQRASGIFRQMERAFDRGSPERRGALAVRVRLAARDGDAAAARSALQGLQREYPSAPELDAAAAEVAAAYLRTGDAATAAAVVSELEGPQAVRMKALLALRDGDIPRARALLLRAVPGLHGEDGTKAIALTALLLRLSPDGGALVAEMVASGLPAPRTLDALAHRASPLSTGERAAILDFAAESAELAGRPEEADALRRVIVEEHPDAPETPAAMLALARGIVERSAEAEEARILLARMIVDYPRSALVPQARRELERLGAAPASR